MVPYHPELHDESMSGEESSVLSLQPAGTDFANLYGAIDKDKFRKVSFSG